MELTLAPGGQRPHRERQAGTSAIPAPPGTAAEHARDSRRGGTLPAPSSTAVVPRFTQAGEEAGTAPQFSLEETEQNRENFKPSSIIKNCGDPLLISTPVCRRAWKLSVPSSQQGIK